MNFKYTYTKYAMIYCLTDVCDLLPEVVSSLGRKGRGREGGRVRMGGSGKGGEGGWGRKGGGGRKGRE